MLSEVVVQGNGAAIEMVGISMGMVMGMALMSGMEKWRISGTWVGMRASMECCISGGCAGPGNLYILTAVVVMIDDSNTRRYKGWLRISSRLIRVTNASVNVLDREVDQTGK